MKVHYGEDLASHTAPKPCVVFREGQAKRRPGIVQAGHRAAKAPYPGCRQGYQPGRPHGPAASSRVANRSGVVRDPSMHGRSLFGNREISSLGRRQRAAGPRREGEEPKPAMNGDEKSDLAVVAMKPANEAGQPAEERVEPRAGAKGNAAGSTRRAQDRASVSQGLDRIRQAARERKKERFTALLHHVDADAATPGLLRAEAGSGPRCGWADMAGLRGGPGAQARGPASAGPSGSLPGTAIQADFIPKPDGRQRPLASRRWRTRLSSVRW